MLKKDYEEKLKLFNQVYSGGFQQNLSQNTLRNENLKFSFPQGPRFDNDKISNSQASTTKSTNKSARAISRQIQGTDNYYCLPSTLKTKDIGFGFGKKEPSYIQKTECPSPNHYKVQRLFDFDTNPQGISKQSGRQLNYCSFGIPHKYYEKAVLGPLEVQSANRSLSRQKTTSKVAIHEQSSPGPGTYKSQSSLKQKSISIGNRIDQTSFLAQMERISKEIPPPASYNPNFELIENSKFKNIGFGIGTKMTPLLKLASPKKRDSMFLNISESNMRMAPGPGTYKIQSNFDKIAQLGDLRKALLKQLNYYEPQQISPSKKSHNLSYSDADYSGIKKKVKIRAASAMGGRFRKKSQKSQSIQQFDSETKINKQKLEKSVRFDDYQIQSDANKDEQSKITAGRKLKHKKNSKSAIENYFSNYN